MPASPTTFWGFRTPGNAESGPGDAERPTARRREAGMRTPRRVRPETSGAAGGTGSGGSAAGGTGCGVAGGVENSPVGHERMNGAQRKEAGSERRWLGKVRRRGACGELSRARGETGKCGGRGAWANEGKARSGARRKGRGYRRERARAECRETRRGREARRGRANAERAGKRGGVGKRGEAGPEGSASSACGSGGAWGSVPGGQGAQGDGQFDRVVDGGGHGEAGAERVP